MSAGRIGRGESHWRRHGRYADSHRVDFRTRLGSSHRILDFGEAVQVLEGTLRFHIGDRTVDADAGSSRQEPLSGMRTPRVSVQEHF